MKYFNDNLFKNTLEERQVTLTKLEELTGISRVTLSSYKNGKTQPPIESIFLIARVLGLAFNKLVEDPLTGDSVNLNLQNKKINKSLENFILKTMQKYCKNCEKGSLSVDFTEHYEILNQQEEKMLADFRRDNGAFEDSQSDEAAANNDSKDKKHNQNQPDQQEAC